MTASEEIRASWAAFEERARQVEWRHRDGSPCPETMNDRLTTDDGGLWWCTTHGQHLLGRRRPVLLTPADPVCPECAGGQTYWAYTSDRGDVWACRCGEQFIVPVRDARGEEVSAGAGR